MLSRPLQELFVDRLTELDRFKRSLEGQSDRRIILVSGPAGMGKSWLLNRFAADARRMGARAALIDFADNQAYDVLLLVRRFRDSLGAADFNALTRTINEVTSPRVTIGGEGTGGGVTLGANNRVDSLTTGDIAGRDIIKDNYFIVQTDNPLLLQALEDRITRSFFACLEELERRVPVVLFFDSYERNSQQTDSWVPQAADLWIRRELLERIRDGRLSRTLAVLAGLRLPEFGGEWNRVRGNLELGAFTAEDVAQYLRENRGLSNLSDAQITALHAGIGGNPQLLGIIGDNLEQAGRPRDDEVW